jgi:hypothetical protein
MTKVQGMTLPNLDKPLVSAALSGYKCSEIPVDISVCIAGRSLVCTASIF